MIEIYIIIEILFFFQIVFAPPDTNLPVTNELINLDFNTFLNNTKLGIINRIFENVLSIELTSAIIKFKDETTNLCGCIPISTLNEDSNTVEEIECNSGLKTVDVLCGTATEDLDDLTDMACDIQKIIESQPYLLLKNKRIRFKL